MSDKDRPSDIWGRNERTIIRPNPGARRPVAPLAGLHRNNRSRACPIRCAAAVSRHGPRRLPRRNRPRTGFHPRPRGRSSSAIR